MSRFVEQGLAPLLLKRSPSRGGLGGDGFDLRNSIKPIPIPAFPLKGKETNKSDGACSALQSATRSRQRGYTLIEVIVAFAVLALALTLLLGTLSGAARQVRWSADAGRAALHAQSLLDQTGVGEYLQPGRSSGEFEGGRYRWTLDIAPYADPSRPDPGIVEPGTARLLRLALSVEWGDAGPRQRLRLQSLRLAAPDPAGAPLP